MLRITLDTTAVMASAINTFEMTKGAHCFSEGNERLLCVMKFDCCSSFHSVIAVVMAATSRIGVLM